MRESVYQARRKMFKSLDIPATRADVTILKWKQRSRLVIWETALRSLLAVKRTMDILISLTALILLSPLFLMVAICILMDDGFPVLLLQKRVGQYGREFRLHKFRSMCRNADQIKPDLLDQNESSSGVIFKMKNDPRVTWTGRILRRFSIDEMPQFLNVLLGDLSVVGPRPPLPEEVAQYSLSDRKRLQVKPGITCLWQIHGRSEIPFERLVSLDMQYIQSQNPLKDIVIIIKTIPAVLFGRGAY